ncbi:MAG: hypothetical protein WB760_17320, partial [Xanthobacteraceae bacterium]
RLAKPARPAPQEQRVKPEQLAPRVRLAKPARPAPQEQRVKPARLVPQVQRVTITITITIRPDRPGMTIRWALAVEQVGPIRSIGMEMAPLVLPPTRH